MTITLFYFQSLCILGSYLSVTHNRVAELYITNIASIVQYSSGTLRGAQTHQHTPTHTFRSDPVHMCRAKAREGKCAEGISVAGSIVKVCMADYRLAAGVGAVGKPQFHRTKSHKSASRHRAESEREGTRQQGKGLRAGT